MNNDFKKFANGFGINSLALHDYQNITPMIIEEREMRIAQMSVFDRMMMDRIIWLSAPIDETVTSIIQAQLMFLDSLDNKDIKIHMFSPGGGVQAGLGIRDIMNYIKSDVATVNMGMCASMGSVLLSSGTKGKRSSLIYSKVMTHMVSSVASGNIQDTRVSQMEAEKFNYILFKILAENAGVSFEEMFEMSRVDKWFTSDEAKKIGLIDEIIGVNEDNKSITNMMGGFDEYYAAEVANK